MSNVLKKITKKYKWLRFLNYKTTKLTVLSAALFGLCLSSGASFAKYRDENYGGENAGVAKIGQFLIEEEGNYIQTPSSFTGLSTNIHAFVITFSIEFHNFEISINYDLDFRLSSYDNEIFAYSDENIFPKKTSFYMKDGSYLGDNPSKELKTFTNGAQSNFNFTQTIGKTLELNKYYIATSNDGSLYEWEGYSYNVSETSPLLKGIINIESGEVSASEEKIKYYKKVFFQHDKFFMLKIFHHDENIFFISKREKSYF